MDNPDMQDIQASQNGDSEAYRRLVERHQSDIAALMWRFSRDPRVCEELVQEVFVQAFFSLPGYRGDGAFEGWLRRIGTRVGYRYWKHKSRRSDEVSLQDFDAADAPEDPDRMTPEAAAGVLEGLMGQLRPEDRLVVTLLHLEGCSTEEIAERTGWNRAMVKMRAYRARKRLQAIAEEQNLWERLGWTT